LFALRKYRDSLDLFTEIAAPPETVIRLYPRLIAGDLSAVPEQNGSEAKVNGNGHGNGHGDQSDESSEAAPETAPVPAPAGQSLYAPSVRSLLRRTEEGSDTSSIREEKDKDKGKNNLWKALNSPS
jgi:hypothetical protein